MVWGEMMGNSLNITTTLNICSPPCSACVALGFFSGLHTGHIAVVRETVTLAKENSLTPCVFTFSTKDDRPAAKESDALLSQEMLCRILCDEGVEELFCPSFSDFREMTPEKFVSDVLVMRFGAAAVVCGEDFRFGKNASGDVNTLRELCGGRIDVTVIPMHRKDGVIISTSTIRSMIREGDMERSAKLLGRPFAIDFTVVRGRQLGRRLDFPTINQPFPDGFIKPRFGVYATLATVDGVQYSSVTNVGVKPTVGSSGVLAETYIHDFSQELYGKNVQIDFLSFIRPEMRFASVGELREQIQRDSDAAKRYRGTICLQKS